ncbi:nucleotidyltransferase family protein [Candidatus Woesearchaeota archaeon]|nr:nucleotidyltransferase family protein [Candidatus Woesearchaeota archaeon]
MNTKNKKFKKSTEEQIVFILKKNGVTKASVFGSYARGDATKNSDVDILIEPPKGIGLGFVGIKLELEKKIGRKVDLLTYNSIHPYLKKYILADEVRII